MAETPNGDEGSLKPLNAIRISGQDALPLIEGGKGIGVTSGESSGAWAATGGVGTFSGVNADSYDEDGNAVPIVYRGKTRRERHEELIAYAVQGGIAQAQRAHEISGGAGPLHVNVLWEMGGCERVLEGILHGARGLVNGVTCGAGMPYRLAQIAAHHGVYCYPIVSSGRAFRALWKRAYYKFADWIGGVVYEDPWRAGGHNGLSNSEDPDTPQDPMPRVAELRKVMRDAGLSETPIVMAGGVWFLDEWADWVDNPELGPIAFQFGTRPLLTEESPISDEWKQRLLTLKSGDVLLHRFSPTGFYSSAVRNNFLDELVARSERQIKTAPAPVDGMTAEFVPAARKKAVFVTPEDKARAEAWIAEGHATAMKTPDDTLIFVTEDRARQIRTDQAECMGCLSACMFSNWAEGEKGSTGRAADPRSFCIQKTLQNIAHGGQVDEELMFAGHNAFRFAEDPFYANGYIPTVKALIDRILTGR